MHPRIDQLKQTTLAIAERPPPRRASARLGIGFVRMRAYDLPHVRPSHARRESARTRTGHRFLLCYSVLCRVIVFSVLYIQLLACLLLKLLVSSVVLKSSKG